MTKVAWGKGTYGMMRYMQRVAPGHYQLKWQGDVVDIKHNGKCWAPYVNGVCQPVVSKTLNAVLHWVDNVWGNEPVPTENMMNPKAGRLMIARKDRGGCCDPGTETYWSM